jgi:hypothetical protein
VKGKKILIVSSELWGDIFVSKHHYAKVLSRQNEVYYLNPVSLKWRFANIFKIPISTIKAGDLTIISYGNPLPALARLPYWLQVFVFKRISRAIQRRLHVPTFDILWSFDLKRFYNLKVWNAKHHLFHAVELIDHPYFIKDAPYRHQVIQSADAVLSIAHLITNQARPWNAHVYEINHGIDLASFERELETITLPGTNSIKAGFVGNFQKSFDFGLLERMAQQNPRVDFIMIGPNQSSNLGQMHESIAHAAQAVARMPNVFFTGAVHSERLPAYLQKLDINLIIYKESFVDGHCNPHKLMGYFYFGKVTLSSFIDQYKDQPDLVMMTRTNDELPGMIHTVSASLAEYNSPALMAKRRAFALDNTYDKQIERIEEILPKVLGSSRTLNRLVD